MIEVVPAILPASFLELQSTLTRLRGAASMVQIDIVDGVFAPSITWPYDKKGEKEFADIVSGNSGMPLWDEFDFEIDLMVSNAHAEIKKWADAGASKIVVHAKSYGAIEALESLQHMRAEGKNFISLGVALSADGSDAYEPYIDLVDFVQVMGIEKVGFQGQPFFSPALSLLRELHTKYPNLALGVDGGVRMENIKDIVSAGATYLIVGSLILSQSDVKKTIREILNVAHV